MTSKKTISKEGFWIEVIEQSGMRIEITRNMDGEVVDIVKYAKTPADKAPRGKGPMGNEQRTPA